MCWYNIYIVYYKKKRIIQLQLTTDFCHRILSTIENNGIVYNINCEVCSKYFNLIFKIVIIYKLSYFHISNK